MNTFVTIQKLSKDVGIDESYIRTMIKNKDLQVYKKDGYKRVYVNLTEFNESMQSIYSTEEEINLDSFLI